MKSKFCKQCNKGEGHYHYRDVRTDFFQSTKEDPVCLCGKAYTHYHIEKKAVWIEGTHVEK